MSTTDASSRPLATRPSIIKRDARAAGQWRGSSNIGQGPKMTSDDDTVTLSKPLSESLVSLGSPAARSGDAGALGQSTALRTGWDRPAMTRRHRPSATADGFDDDDNGDYAANLSVSSRSTFADDLGLIAIPLDLFAKFLHNSFGFDFYAFVSRRHWNARSVHIFVIHALRSPRVLVGAFIFILTLALSTKERAHTANELDTIKTPTRTNSNEDVRSKENGNGAMLPSSSMRGSIDSGRKAEKGIQSKMNLPIPIVLSNLSDLDIPFDALRETPYFWDVHFSGETIAERVLSQCYGLIQAAEHGMQQPDFTEDVLSVFDLDGNKYVNVDLTTEAGLTRAKKLDLAGKRIANIIASPNLHGVANIFTERNKGRTFAIFRHPVDRAVSMYYYLSTATWDPMFNPKLKDMNLQEYAKSSSIENNWLTRFLVGKTSGALNADHLALAKRIVRNKILVGLYDEMETSLARFDKYFGWSDRSYGEVAENLPKCRLSFIQAGDKRHDVPSVEPKSKEWELIVRQNRYDMSLYEYVEGLYKQQAGQLFDTVA